MLNFLSTCTWPLAMIRFLSYVISIQTTPDNVGVGVLLPIQHYEGQVELVSLPNHIFTEQTSAHSFAKI